MSLFKKSMAKANMTQTTVGGVISSSTSGVKVEIREGDGSGINTGVEKMLDTVTDTSTKVDISVSTRSLRNKNTKISDAAKQKRREASKGRRERIYQSKNPLILHEKKIEGDALFSKKIEKKLDSYLSDTEKKENFDKFVPDISYDILGSSKVKNLDQIHAFEKANPAVKRNDYLDFLDKMQKAPNLTKALKPFKIAKTYGYFVFDTLRMENNHFVMGELDIPLSNGVSDNNVFGFCSVYRGIEAELISNIREKGIVIPDSLRFFSGVDKEGKALGDFYIQAKRARLDFLYALLEKSEALTTANNMFGTEKNTPKNSEIEKAIDNKIRVYLKKTFTKDGKGDPDAATDLKEMFSYVLGLYRFCMGVDSFEKQTAPSDSGSTVTVDNLKVINIATKANETSDLAEMMYYVQSIEQKNAFVSQMYPECIPTMHPSALVEAGISFATEKFFEDGADPKNWKLFSNEDLRQYFFDLIRMKSWIRSYTDSGIVRRVPKILLNLLDLPKVMEDYAGFICEARVCAMKGDRDRGLWGYISNEREELQIYKTGGKMSKVQTSLLSTLFMRYNGDIFTNPLISVIDKSLIKISEETAKEIIDIQKAILMC